MSALNNSTPRLAVESSTPQLAARNPLMVRMVSLEMCRLIEHWRFEGDAVHILLTLPMRGCGCRQEHCWFVNRDGKTRCWECDQKYVKERDAKFAAAVAAQAASR